VAAAEPAQPVWRVSKLYRPEILPALMLQLALFVAAPARAEPLELLNVSYDPTRELYRAINSAFIASSPQYADLTIRQSHGGSGTQARAIVDGLEADVATLAIPTDTDAIAKAGLIPADWQKRLRNDSLPYVSTIVFVVRKGNPRGIKDWPDIIKPGVQIITPNPKTSGNGKLSFIAAWGYVKGHGGSDAEALDFVKKLYAQVPVLDLAARASTITFAQKKLGDVHLTWENEAFLEVEEAKGNLEIVVPSSSILAEPAVTWVDANIDRPGTKEVAKAYLDFLYTPVAQDVIAKNYYRPTDPTVLAKYRSQFPDLKLFPIKILAKNWADAVDKFFGDGKLFDSFYKPKK
jgi:sulfate transport system substrate-binding protein